MRRERFTHAREVLLRRLDLGREVSEDELLAQIDEVILSLPAEADFSLRERQELRRELFYSLGKLDVLEELLRDPGVTEIMVNGSTGIYIEKEGHVMRCEKEFSSPEKLLEVIQQIAARCNRVINESMPIVDARLPDGTRVNAVVAPAALNGPILTLRRFSDRPMTMESLVRMGSLSREAAELLHFLVCSRYTILIGGGTGSGKTTLLGALAAWIPKEERLITIEDNAELRIEAIPNLVRLEAKNANLPGGRNLTIRDLIRTALRMRPDRIIVGEVRGEEALDMLQAMNTGHEGSLCTAHANSARDMLARLETMVILGADLPLFAIRQQIASGIDILLHLGRLRDKSRKLLEIWEVLDYEEGEIRLHPLYLWEEGQGLVKQEDLVHREKLERYGGVRHEQEDEKEGR